MDLTSINTIRTLSMDAVQAANSGHPGTPMADRDPAPDANGVTEAWKLILQLHHEPAVSVLSRQAAPTIDRKKYAAASGLTRGAYVLADARVQTPRSSSSVRAARLHSACKHMRN